MSTTNLMSDHLFAEEKSISALTLEQIGGKTEPLSQSTPSKIQLPSRHHRKPFTRSATREVCYNGRSIQLYRRAKLFEIFRLFCQASDHFLTADQIIEQLYGIKISSQISLRNKRCMHNSIVKMISRGRILATIGLGNPREDAILWFTHVRQLDGWHLIQKLR